jgi:hypothetical protein
LSYSPQGSSVIVRHRGRNLCDLTAHGVGAGFLDQHTMDCPLLFGFTMGWGIACYEPRLSRSCDPYDVLHPDPNQRPLELLQNSSVCRPLSAKETAFANDFLCVLIFPCKQHFCGGLESYFLTWLFAQFLQRGSRTTPELSEPKVSGREVQKC